MNCAWGAKKLATPSIGPSAVLVRGVLFLWRSGDDLSCKGVMASYRFWAPSGVALKLGDSQTLTSVLDPSVWTTCYGQHDTSGFAGVLENAMGIGFTFGGQSFFSHGVYLRGGSATFKVYSFKVR